MFWWGPGTAPGMRRQILAGVLAGAAGTTALNALTYLDMAVRGRPSSGTPEQAVEQAASKVGTDVPMVASGLTDPRSWGVAGWLSDIVPHIAYGYATAATVELAG